MTGLAVERNALLAPVAIGELVMNPRWAGSAGDSLRPKAVILTSRELTFADADASSRSSPGQFSKRGDLESW